MRFPEIDYDTHPAYRMAADAVRYDDAFLDERIRAADTAYTAYTKLDAPSDADAQQVLSQIRAAAADISAHVARQNTGLIAREWLESAMRWTLADITYEL